MAIRRQSCTWLKAPPGSGGDCLEHVVEAGPGDFVFIPAHTVHQEINASAAYPTVWVVTRSNPDPIVVNVPEVDKFAEPPAREQHHP